MPIEKAMALIAKPEDAFDFFKEQAIRDKSALQKGLTPEGRFYPQEDLFLAPEFAGCNRSSSRTA